MGMLEKQSLVNAITLRFAEDFNLKVSQTKSILEELLTQYHITISNVPLQMIATSLGHANLNQTNRYSLYGAREMTTTIRNAL